LGKDARIMFDTLLQPSMYDSLSLLQPSTGSDRGMYVRDCVDSRFVLLL